MPSGIVPDNLFVSRALHHRHTPVHKSNATLNTHACVHRFTHHPTLHLPHGCCVVGGAQWAQVRMCACSCCFCGWWQACSHTRALGARHLLPATMLALPPSIEAHMAMWCLHCSQQRRRDLPAPPPPAATHTPPTSRHRHL